MSTSTSILEITELQKAFPDGTIAVNGLNLSIQPGEVFVMLGENGAGKSTTIHLILNYIEPTGGSIRVAGWDMVRDPMAGKRHLAYVSENVMLYGELNALENLQFFYTLGRGTKLPPGTAADVLNFVRLPEDAWRRPVSTYSKGMRQKTGLAIAVAKDADLLLLDEPTASLDPQSAAEIIACLGRLAGEGKAVLITTHDIFRSMMMPGRLGIMKKGRLIFERKTADLQNTNMERLYLDMVQDDRPDEEMKPCPSA